VDAANLMSFPPGLQNDPPLALAVTQYHFVLLRKDRVVAIRALDEHAVYEEPVKLVCFIFNHCGAQHCANFASSQSSGEVLRGMTSDPIEKTYWAFSDASLFELTVTREARDMWKVYLDRGDHERSLALAQTAAQREKALSAQADALFAAGKLLQAAQSYARSSARFEEVTLKFIDAGARDPLRQYLVARLERFPKTVSISCRLEG
jgi:hypothetical protein